MLGGASGVSKRLCAARTPSWTGNPQVLAAYSAKTRWRAWNGQRSIGDLPGQGDADGPDCALAGTDPVASAHRADLSAQQARP
jgi:hypothetical protein